MGSIKDLFGGSSDNILLTGSITTHTDTRVRITRDKNGRELRDESRRIKYIKVPKICGYAVTNIGQQDIEYQTKEYRMSEGGKIAERQITKVARPGEEFILASEYFAMFIKRPEYLFELKNAKISCISHRKGQSEDDEEVVVRIMAGKDGITSSYDKRLLRFVDDENLVPNMEYFSVFGYLYKNGVKGIERQRTAGKNRKTVQEMAAEHFRRALA